MRHRPTVHIYRIPDLPERPWIIFIDATYGVDQRAAYLPTWRACVEQLDLWRKSFEEYRKSTAHLPFYRNW